MYENLRPLYANWEPGRPVALGDFGILVGRIFVHEGNVADLGITFQVRNDPTPDNKFFASQGSVTVTFTGKGGGPVGGGVNVKASLKVDFSSEKSVFFNAAGCTYSMIADKTALGAAVMAKYRATPRQWERSRVVVTDVVTAGSTTVLVSGASSSSVILEASADVPQIDLGNPEIGLTINTAQNVGYQVVASQGLIPLFGLCKIQSTFLWFNDKFKPLSRSLVGETDILDVMENSDLVKTEAKAEDLFFGQLR